MPLSSESAAEELKKCCGSGKWVAEMLSRRPFTSVQEVYTQAARIWYESCGPEDWQEAFTHHPRIGDLKSLAAKFANTQDWASGEQSGVSAASLPTLEALAAGNDAYEKKFGYIFIVCATGKSADEMLQLLETRLRNDPDTELRIAMGEQSKITAIRLHKLLSTTPSPMQNSQITTHVLDTSQGKPGRGIQIELLAQTNHTWTPLAQGITDADGRVSDLLAPGRLLPPGTYKLVFHTGPYFDKNEVEGFYPLVEIIFHVRDESHYHVPLLISPFGYSTYRGS